VEARDKAGRKHRKAKSRSKSRKAGSDERAGGTDGSSEPRLSSPSKPRKHHAAAAASVQHHNSSTGTPDEPLRRDRTSTAGNQIVLSDPTAALVLVATQEFVRVYSVGHAVAADRTTMRKVAMQGTLQFASAFVACGAPALACLLDMEGEIHLQVRTAGQGYCGIITLLALSCASAPCAKLKHNHHQRCCQRQCILAREALSSESSFWSVFLLDCSTPL
jgi:hypothetical protein